MAASLRKDNYLPTESLKNSEKYINIYSKKGILMLDFVFFKFIYYLAKYFIHMMCLLRKNADT